MSARAREGTRLAELIAMAAPLCRAAQRQSPRAGAGAPPAYADWQMAVLIMVAVMARRKNKSAQYRYVYARRVWLQGRLGLSAFPARSTYFQRYRQGHVLFQRAVVLQGQCAVAEGVADPRTVAVDKSLIAARGAPGSVHDRRRGRWRRGVDRQADWGYSEHHGWVYGYSYEVLVSATARSVVFPLIVSAGPASVSEQRSFGPKIAQLPPQTRYVLADAAYDSNAYGQAVEYSPAGRRAHRRLVCPLQPRAGKPPVGRYPHRGRREQLRQRRAKRWAFWQSPQGRRLHRRRSKTVEPFNEWFKAKFDLDSRVWHRGLANNATQITAGMFAYQLLVRYHHARGGTDGQIQWILDTL